MSQIQTAKAFRALDGSWRVLFVNSDGSRDERLPGTLDVPDSLPTVDALVEQMRGDGYEPLRALPDDATPATDAHGYFIAFKPVNETATTRLMSTVAKPPEKAAPEKPKAPQADEAARAALRANLRNSF